MQPLTCMVKAIEIILLVELNENNVYKITKYCKNRREWASMESLDYIVKLSWAYLTLYALGKWKIIKKIIKKKNQNQKTNHMHHITLFKATFDCNYCKFYSLFGNLFQLNMKSHLQWISQHIHKIIMNSHNRMAHNGLLLSVPVRLTKTH